jgi:hypothetical protein
VGRLQLVLVVPAKLCCWSVWRRSLLTRLALCAGPTRHVSNVPLHIAWQDFGNFQDMEGKEREKTERLRFGRFFYRFPNGESGAGAHITTS